MREQSSREHAQKELAKLWAAFGKSATTERDRMQIAIYSDKLVSFPSQVVSRGVDDAIERSTRFPSISELLGYVSEAEKLSQQRYERAKAGPKIEHEKPEQPTIPEHERDEYVTRVMKSELGQRALANGWGWHLARRCIDGFDVNSIDPDTADQNAAKRQQWNAEADAMDPMPLLVQQCRKLSATIDAREKFLRDLYLRAGA